MSIKHIISGTLFAALALLFVGCEEEEKYQLHFSHYLHVTEMEMACEDCHGEPGGPAFDRITHDTCLACHEEPEAEEISTETCGICHQEEQVELYEAAAQLVEANTNEVEVVEADEPEVSGQEEQTDLHASVFLHTEALAEKCIDCHAELMSEELEMVPALQRDEIIAIRNKAHLSDQDCNTCHAGMDPAVPPASHDLAWTRRHGQFCMQEDASCSVCHTQESCMDCHSVMQPVSHNNTFRLRTHGILAATDRTSCMVCHQEDSCVSCHSNTRPRSHNSRWAASGRNPTHCIACHTDTGPGQGCVVCHEGGNDLELHARYWGDGHENAVAIGCYQCHWFNAPAGTL